MLIYIHTHNTKCGVPQMPLSLKKTHWHTQTVQTDSQSDVEQIQKQHKQEPSKAKSSKPSWKVP